MLKYIAVVKNSIVTWLIRLQRMQLRGVAAEALALAVSLVLGRASCVPHPNVTVRPFGRLDAGIGTV
jgi:hypothetical protein